MAIQTRLEDMQVGDKIVCEWYAPNLTGGDYFNRLGAATGPVTNPSPISGAYMSRFYWIYVGNDFEGRKLLIADRNLGSSVSWDQLNTLGYATEGGIEITSLGLDPTAWKTNIRLLTGGTSAATAANSEWDKYIVNGPVGSDTATWNWEGMWSWTSTTGTAANASGPSARTVRGYNGVQVFSTTTTSDTTPLNSGFRPVLVAESLAAPIQKKHLIYSNGEYKKWNTEWIVISTSLPSSAEFLEKGMDDLSGIPLDELNAIKPFEVVTWSDGEAPANTTLTFDKSLYRPLEKDYYGNGIIETVIEELPISHKQLILNADHQNCTFEFSLDGGTTWYTINIQEVKDITAMEGNSLKVRVTLPDDNATITAISYAWA